MKQNNNLTVLSKRLADTLAYYVNNPKKRCIKENVCRYSGKTLGLKTKGCFIGSLLPSKKRIELDTNYSGTTISALIKYGVDLPDFIKNNSKLMTNFQLLHDKYDYWDNDGLNKAGKEYLEYIINSHNLNKEYFKKFLVE